MPGQRSHALRDARSPDRPRASRPSSALTTPALGRARALAPALGRGEGNRPTAAMARTCLPHIAAPFCEALVILKTDKLDACVSLRAAARGLAAWPPSPGPQRPGLPPPQGLRSMSKDRRVKAQAQALR